MKKVCESALFHQKNESYPQRGAENAQKDAVASKVYLTFDATAPRLRRVAFGNIIPLRCRAILPGGFLYHRKVRGLTYDIKKDFYHSITAVIKVLHVSFDTDFTSF